MDLIDIAVLSLFLACVQASTEEYSLRNDLTQRYDDIRRQTRPVVDYNDNVTVTYGLLLQGFDFSTQSKNFVGTFIQKMKWRVPELSWDPSRYGNIRSLSMRSDQVWLPDIYLYNNEYAGMARCPKLPIPLSVRNDGFITWDDPINLSVKCTDKRNTYPGATKDTRWICNMIFRSWTHDSSAIDLKLSRSDIDLIEVAVNPAWSITFTQAERSEVTRSCCPETRGIDLVYWMGLKSPWL